MSTRRQFIQALPATGAAFAVAGHLVLNESPAHAQEAAPLKGHGHRSCDNDGADTNRHGLVMTPVDAALKRNPVAAADGTLNGG
jgi:hypothetical protein